MSIKYIGLDFETSGSNPWDKNVPIQLGMHAWETARGYDTSFYSLIGRWSWSEFEWNEKASTIHNIPIAELATAPPISVVDIQAANWIIHEIGYSNRMNVIPVGWNVGGFDRQFITRWMPNLNSLLSYRTVDLNSLVFVLAGDSEKAYKDYKRAAKDYANGKLLIDEVNRHDALVDAKAALHEFAFLRTVPK